MKTKLFLNSRYLMTTPVKHLRLYILGLLFLLAFTAPVAGQGSEDNNGDARQPLRIAIDRSYAPFTVLAPDGQPAGLLVEMWRAWSQVTNTPVEFIPMSWSETLDSLKSGRADIHSGLFMSAERALWLEFSEPIERIATALFIKAGSKLKGEFEELQGVKVGVPCDSFQEQWVAANHPHIDMRIYENHDDLVQAVFQGEVEAIVGEVPGVFSALNRLGLPGLMTQSSAPLFSNMVHAGVAKGRTDLVALINDGFSRLPLNKLEEMERRWLPGERSGFYQDRQDLTRLTPEEEAWILQHPAVSVAVTDFISPVDIVDDSGGYTGLNPELLALLRDRLGIKFVPTFFQKWEDVVDAVMSGKADTALSMSDTPERRAHLLFTEPYAYDSIVAIVRAGTDFSQWSDLGGKHASVIRGLAVLDDVQELVGADGLVSILESNADGLKLLSQGITDVHISSLVMYGNEQRRNPVPGLVIAAEMITEGGSLRIAIHNDKPILASILGKGLKRISSEELRRLRNRWLAPQQEQGEVVELTSNEVIWLAEHPHIRIGAMEAWPPMNFVNELGEPSGFGADYVALLNRSLGGALEIVPGQFKDNLEKLKAHGIDALMDVTPKPEREEFLNFTRIYLDIPHVIVARKNGPYYASEVDLAGKTLALERGFGNVKYFEENYPDVEIREYDSTGACLDAVSRGQADAYAGNQAAAMYIIEREFFSNLQIQGRLNKSGSALAIGVRKDWPELAILLDRLMAKLPNGDIRSIRRKWSGLGVNDKKAQLRLSPDELDWIKEHPTIKVAATDWPPFEYTNEDGEREGITTDVLMLLAKRVGLEVELVQDNWDKLLRMLESGELDLAPGLIQTPERNQYLFFTEPFVTSRDVIYTHVDTQGISSLEDLKGKTVAVENGYYTAEMLREEYPSIKQLTVDTTLSALTAVTLGKADAYIGTHAVGAFLINKHVIADLKVAAYVEGAEVEVRMGVPRDKKILFDILKKGLESITDSELREIKRNYISADTKALDTSFKLTPQEKAWLEQHKELRLGVPPAWAPFDYVDAQGKHAGVSSDYISILGEILGVEMAPLTGYTWQEMLEQAQQGKVDVVSSIVPSEERRKYLNFTEPYLNVPLVVITREDAPTIKSIADLEGKPIAVVKGYTTRAYLERDYPEHRLLLVDTLEQALRAVSEGEAMAVIDSIAATEYAKRQLGLKKLKVAAPTDYSLDIAIGVRKDLPELLVIMDRALKSFTKYERDIIYDKWVNMRMTERIDWSLVWRWGLVIGLVAFLILGSFIYWNRKLSTEVADRKAAESKVRAMSEASLDAVIMINGRGEVLFWNQAAERMFGYSAADAMGQRMHSLFVPEEYREAAYAGLRQFASNGTGAAMGKVLEFYALDGEGRRFPVEVAVSPFKLDDGWYAVGSVRDITERKKTEEALRDAEERSRMVLESAAEGIFGVDENGALLFINSAACKMLGVCDSSVTGKDVHDLIHHSHEDGSPYPSQECPMYWSFTRRETHTVGDEVLWHSDGTCFPVEYTSAPIVKDDALVGAVITFRDITERRLIEEQVRAAREELLLIFDNSQVGIMFMYNDCELARVNKSMARLIGWESPKDMIGFTMGGLHLSEKHFQEFKQANHSVLLRGEQSHIEYQLKRRDDSAVWCSLSGKAVDPSTPPDLTKGVIWVVEDITLRKQMEDELRKSEAHFRNILTTAAEGFWHIDNNATTLELNDAMCGILGRGRDEAIGMNLFEFLDEENKAVVRDQMKLRGQGKSSSYELALNRPDGSKVPVYLNATPIVDSDGVKAGSFAMVTDITDLKAAEEELRIKEKRLRSYFSNSLVGVTLISPDSGWIEVNERFLEMLGYSFEELQSLTWAELSHPEEREAGSVQYERMLAGEIDSYTLDKRFVRKNGSVIHTNLAVSCVRNDAGDVKMVMGSHIDISERIKAQRERDDAFEVISSSINYATNIQGAILPSAESMTKTLVEHFVLWEPRDKVGGDIYFMKPWGLGKLVALGDCTGHGVPGAFMTLIVNGALEMAALEVPPGEVGVLLQRVHQLLQKALDQDKEEGSSDDGIEMGICYLAPRNKKMFFGGARFSLFRVQGGEVEEIKGDKKGLGYRAIPANMTYGKQEVPLDGGATFYMTTDGFIDQVGGEKHRGFGKKRFKNLLLELENVPMQERGARLLAALEEYQGEERRRDDVAVIGFRLG